MKIRLALGALALAALAACGGGGGTDPAPVQAPPTLETTRLVVFGDSLMGNDDDGFVSFVRTYGGDAFFAQHDDGLQVVTQTAQKGALTGA